MSQKVEIVEVGPRDGLQNESAVLDMTTRLKLIDRLTASGLKRIEIGAFVHPEWVPQMAGSGKLISKVIGFQKQKKSSRAVRFSALVPNQRGMEDAMQSGIKEVAVFSAVSESFSQRNINCSIQESLKRFEPVFAVAKKKRIKVRAYLSTCFGCPYEGSVSQARVVRLARKLLAMGADELSIGDTIGVATPLQVRKLLQKLSGEMDFKKLAMHFHDTRGTAIANILESLNHGVRIFDSSIGGLGGCPYAPGASGNVATEDVVYLLHGMGMKTGIDLQGLIKTNHWLAMKVQHPLPSRVSLAGLPTQ